MAKTIVVCGYGTGISAATAERFGREGFSVALVARNVERLNRGVADLTEKGLQASAFPADLSQVESIGKLFGDVRQKLGAITVLHWNATSGGATDLLTASTGALRETFEIPVVSLTRAVQEVLPDLRAQPDSALLVTNGGLALFDADVDELAISWDVMGLAIANAAKHKAVRLLAAKLKKENIYVAELMVAALVKGTASDNGSATLEPAAVADRFWAMYQDRTESSVIIR